MNQPIPIPTAQPVDEKTQNALSLINALTMQRMAGNPITASDVAELMGGESHPMVTQWVTQNLPITITDLKRAVWAAKVRAELGCVPQHVQEFVEAYARIERAHVKYDGMIGRDPIPYVLDDATGEKMFIPPDMVATDPSIGNHVHFKFSPKMTMTAFSNKAWLTSDRLGLKYTKDAIETALAVWKDEARSELRLQTFNKITGYLNQTKKAEADAAWLATVKAAFSFDEKITPEFTVAILKKFCWQVLRKMRGLPVTNHLMPVILGAQGKGKSTFVTAMIEPLEELAMTVDFETVCEGRNIEMWQSYILFLDEMGYASKADIDMVKSIITAETLSRRPMGTNRTDVVDQNATFIGCSNKELEQLIKDTTGIRRFAPIRFSNKPDRTVINATDWPMLWRSVDFNGPDPMLPFGEALAEVQEEAREPSRVEHWLSEFDPDQPAYKRVTDRGLVRARDLHALFRDFEEEAYPGYYKTSQTEFGNELKRLNALDSTGKRFVRLDKKQKGVNWYRFEE